ncbi:hypothetical protein ABPG75_006576 [Micractinium tetrahymenae]
MRFEGLVEPQKTPQHQIVLPVCAVLSLLATLALWTLAWASEGLQQLLLLCLVRLAVLTCIGAASYRALSRGRRGDSPTPGSGGGAPSPRTSLTQAALCLQLAWLATELVLGSGLLVLHPYLLGPAAEYASSTAALLSVLPLACAAAMSGCFLFLQRLAGRRGRGGRGGGAGGARAAASPRAASLECGLGAGLAPSHAAGPHGCIVGASRSASSACLHLGASPSSSLDGAASPLSDSGSYSSCDSASFYPSPCSSGSLLGMGSGGAPSPTGHVRGGDLAHHEAALQAACEILLVEHQLDTKEYCLFVHKRLRPIRTRPEDKGRPAPEKPGLLRELITNSFTFQHDHELRAQLAAGMAAATSAGGSGASSLTFQQAAAAATGVEVM